MEDECRVGLAPGLVLTEASPPRRAPRTCPGGDGTGEQARGRQAVPRVTARMARATRRARPEREPLPGAGVASDMAGRPQELGGRSVQVPRKIERGVGNPVFA